MTKKTCTSHDKNGSVGTYAGGSSGRFRFCSQCSPSDMARELSGCAPGQPTRARRLRNCVCPVAPSQGSAGSTATRTHA
eukprot:2729246-Rhodomonas_salina.2